MSVQGQWADLERLGYLEGGIMAIMYGYEQE